MCFETLFRRSGDLALHPDGPAWQPMPPLSRHLGSVPVILGCGGSMLPGGEADEQRDVEHPGVTRDREGDQRGQR